MFWYDVMYNVFEKLKFSCLRNFPTPTAAGPRAAAAAALSLFVRCSTSNGSIYIISDLLQFLFLHTSWSRTVSGGKIQM